MPARASVGAMRYAPRPPPRHEPAPSLPSLTASRARAQGRAPVTATVVAIFAVVYVGMILGGLPFVQLDRTGIALLGAIALVALGVLTPEQATQSLHLPTLILLF